MKKLLLSLGSVSAIIAPVTAVIACGDKTSKSDKVFSKLGLKLGKQDQDNGVVLAITGSGNAIKPGNYYFTKDQLKVGDEILVPSTTVGQKVTLVVKTANITGSTNAVNAKANLEVKSTVAGTAAAALDTGITITPSFGDNTKFIATQDKISKSLDNDGDILNSIQYALESKVPEKLFDTDSNKKLLKDFVNKLLKDIGKEILVNDAFKFRKPEIEITKLELGAKKSSAADFEYIKLYKQDPNNGVVLAITGSGNDILSGNYYFTKDQLKVGDEIEVPSTTVGQKVTLVVKTANITGSTNAVTTKANLEVKSTTSGTVTTALDAGITITPSKGDDTKFVDITKDGFSIEIIEDSDIIGIIKYGLQDNAPEKLISSKIENLVELINKILTGFDKHVIKDDLEIDNPGISIDISKVTNITSSK